jgi:hypothetical protein
VVREGKGDAYREVALNAEARDALDAWTAARRKQLQGSAQRALFVSRNGARLSTRALDLARSRARARGRPQRPRRHGPRRPRTTRRYDRSRHSLDRHPTYAATSAIATRLPNVWTGGEAFGMPFSPTGRVDVTFLVTRPEH